MTTNLPTLTCDADSAITRASINEATQGKPEAEQHAIVNAWFQHLRTITGDASIRMQGITYAPNAQGRMEIESPTRTLQANKALLAKHVSSLCNER